jgi:hypothetical protein
LTGADPKETAVVSKSSGKPKGSNKDFSKVDSCLVVFNAVWSDKCYYMYSMWVKMSNRFSTQKFKFLDVDVSALDKLARIYKVNTRSTSGLLPTLILFEDGKEVERFPFIDEKGREAVSVEYRERELIKFFDLDKRYLATRDLGLEKKKGAT